jgi:glycosyltransferase involved in cell wall biosynthesis
MGRYKVLLNASMVTESATGVGVYTVQLINHLVPHLRASNIDFDIYTYHKKQFKDVESTRLISLGNLLDKLLITKVTIHRHIWNIIYLAFIGRKYNMLYSFSSHGTLYHKNQIVTIHDLICFAYPEQHKSQYFYFKKYIPYLINHSKHVIAISNFTMTEVLRYYGLDKKSKVSVIYNGVDHLKSVCIEADEIKFVNSLTGRNPYCLTVGASYPHKNIDTLLEVAKRLENTLLKFIIVNKHNSYIAQMKQKANDMNLSNVFFLDYVEEKKLAALYKLANLNLYLSLYEGFGFPPAEALSFGTTSLISNHGALLEVYENMMDFADPLNVEIIVSKLKGYMNFKPGGKVSFDELKAKYNWEKASFLTSQLIDNYVQQ